MLEPQLLEISYLDMPTYYFHTEDGRCFPDEQGTDFPDLKAAASAALQVLADHLKGMPEDFWSEQCLQVHVDEPTGLRLLTLTVTARFAAAASRGVG